MINVKKLKVIPISKQTGRFETDKKYFKRLFLFMVVSFIISGYLTATSFGVHIEDDRMDIREIIYNYTTIK